jgi:hypothetical protein
MASASSGYRLGEFSQGKDQPAQHLLGKVVEEVTLILVVIESP